jgi:alpha-mannosidase
MSIHVAAAVLLTVLLGSAPVAGAAEATPAAATKDTFLIVPHTHWEGAVFKTREEYLQMGLPNILKALRLLKSYPDYHFVLDQACYVRPFLERYPEEEASFRKFVKQGRLQVIGGTDCMPDVNMPSGESFVRQILYGKGYFRRKLGVEVTSLWDIDTFGHHAQIPQILKLAGYKACWLSRGIPDGNVPSDFFWEGIDGTRLATYRLPYGYGLVQGAPDSLPGFTKFIKERYDALTPFTRGACRVGLSGGDVYPPEEHLPRMVEEYNRQPDASLRLQLAVPADYEALVEQRRPDPRPVFKGEFNPMFQGTYGSRIELKQRTREAERLLTTGEKLGVLAHWLGAPPNDRVLWQAWEPLIFNQTHDCMSGVMTDHVYEDVIRGYDFAQRIADAEVETKLRDLGAKIDTRGEGIALVVWNTMSWLRTDLATASVGLTDNARDLKLLGPDGQPVPLQILSSQHDNDGALLRAEFAFVARDIPALGYAVYRVLPLQSPAAAATAASLPDAVLENEYCQVKCDPATGAITSLILKDGKWNALGGPGNVVAEEPDHGDLWEIDHPLDGGRCYATRDPHPAPQPGKAVLSTGRAGMPAAVLRGPVFSELAIPPRPFGQKGSFATSVRLCAGLRRIDIHTTVVNRDKSVRYRALFPTSIRKGQNVQEIPFGAIERPDAIDMPAQNWIDYGDGRHGLALLNVGHPGNNVSDGTMMLTLMRCEPLASGPSTDGTNTGLDYWAPDGSSTGFELGKPLTFHYALLPHAGDWRQAGVYRDGLELNNPLVARTASAHAGVLPARWGFLEISRPNLVVSALKGGPGGTAVLRLYEASGEPVKGATVKLSAHVLSAEEVNLMEDPGRRLDLAADAVQLDFHPFEIKTVKLSLQRPDGTGK